MFLREEVISRLQDRMMEISDRQFEQLTKIVLTEVENVDDAELTAKSGDGGIDVIGYLGRDLYEVTMGIQSKQYTNHIAGAAIRSFAGALTGQGHRWGVFVTTSDFKHSAIEEAEGHPITLVNGERLAEIMLDARLGVSEPDEGEFIIDAEFWDIFDLTKGDGMIPSEEVPQANDLGVLPIVLKGMNKGYRYKHDIVSYLEMETGESWRTRQGDYYALAGWTMGYIHKDTVGEYDGRKMRKWGLTQDGQRFVKLLEESDIDDPMNDDEIREDLARHLRQMEVVSRILEKIREAGEMSHSDLKDAVFPEVELNEKTSARRVSTVANWMDELLPEVVRKGHGGSTRWQYVGTRLDDY